MSTRNLIILGAVALIAYTAGKRKGAVVTSGPGTAGNPIESGGEWWTYAGLWGG